jgi:poly-gamma-glutamate synthesis protein (capsule biosynthesis protein)
MVPGVAARQLDLIARDIRLLKQNTDYIVVNFHWGTEKARKPDAADRRFAHRVIEAGADAIIGHHPHVLQGIEMYKQKPIVYSLGNLVFGGNSRDTYDTGIFEIRLSEDEPKYTFIPVRVRNWKATALEGIEGEKVVKEVRNLSAIFPKSIFN